MREIKKIKCQDGETFTVAGIEFIKFPGKGGKTPVVARDTLFRSAFGANNDLRNSKVLYDFGLGVRPFLIFNSSIFGS